MQNIIQPGEGEKLLVLTDLVTIKIASKDTGNRYSVIEETVPPLAGPPPHQHVEVELFYVIEGEFEFLLDDLTKPIRVGAGGVVNIPSMAVHTFRNVGTKAGRVLVTILPGDFENFFRRIGTPVTDAQIPDLNVAPDLSKVDVPAALAAAPEYGLKFIL